MSNLRDQLQSKLGASYALERELGGGGMSRVFVATEAALGRRVVVKVLPPDLAQGVSVDRFKREIQVAAQLQHPHIVPVLSAGDVDGLPYFTMPFIEGESLRARLAGGELPISDIVAILRDVAKALETAHARGVVHRDIKPDNVLLSGGSAMVTDFGVAKAIATAASAGDRAETLTLHGIALGTPMYMAPEQSAADPRTDHRADIYALGTMAYEMLVGRAPFAGRLQQQLAAAHATETPIPVTQVRPAVPQALATLVMRCLEKHPADRPQTAREILHALDSIATPAGGSTASGGRWWTRQRAAIVATVSSVVAAVAAVPVYRALARPQLNPRLVVVAPFDNLTGDSALTIVGRMASEFISEGVAEMDSTHVVSSLTLLSEAGGTAGTHDVRRLAARLKAGTAVSGAFTRQGDSLRFQAQVTDVSSGNLLQSVDGVIGPTSDPMIGIRLLRERLMGALASSSDANGISMGIAPRYEAFREFVRGQELFNRRNYKEAAPFFSHASVLDSTYTRAYVMLATSNINEGRWAIADSVIRLVEARGGRMSRDDRLLTDLTRSTIDGDYDAVFRLTRTAAARDSAWLWLYLTGLNGVRLNYPHAAVAAFSAVSNPDSSWSPFWTNFASAYHQLGDFKNELRVAKRGDAIHPGELVTQRLRAVTAAGDTAGVRVIVDSVVRTSTDTVNTPADMMLLAALEFRAHGRPKDAADLLARARTWLAARPPAEANSRRSLRRTTANVVFAMGQFDSAYARYADLARDTTDINARGRLGLSAALLHDTTTAMRVAGELEQTKSPYAHGFNTYWRAAITATLGDKELAVRLLNQAIKEGAQIGIGLHRLEEFQSLRGYPPFEAILRPRG